MNSPQRGRRSLTLDEIVERAMEIAAAQGERGLTMRKVAEACRVTPMALYHHIDDKEALLTLIVDRVVGEAIDDLGSSDLSWDSDLAEFACRMRSGLLANRTAGEVFLRRPILSENLARCTELMFQAANRGGLVGEAIAEATDAVVLLIMGSVANDLSRPPEVRFALAEYTTRNEAPLLNERLDDYSIRDGEDRLRAAIHWLLDGMVAAET